MADRDDDTEGDFWRDVRAAGQAKRASNREDSAALLTQAGIRFDKHNAGAHLIVTHNGATVDFWPGTGLWKKRDSRLKGRGVRRLLLQLGVAIPAGVEGRTK